MWSTIHPKFWPKKPVMSVRGTKIAGHTVRRVAIVFSRFEVACRWTLSASASSSRQ